MSAIFLSASIPVAGRGTYYEDADPFLIQFAVRELLVVALGRRPIVWGGHPAITPMVWSVCEDLGVQYAHSVLLFQSKLFQDYFPQENERFANVRYVDAVQNDRERSLLSMRKSMMEGEFEAGVFIGGMNGVEEECDLFMQLHPRAKIIALGSPGGAAKRIAKKHDEDVERIDYLRLFAERLEIDTTEPRNSHVIENDHVARPSF